MKKSFAGIQPQMGCDVINFKGQLNFPKCHLHKPREHSRVTQRGQKAFRRAKGINIYISQQCMSCLRHSALQLLAAGTRLGQHKFK
jgi:hypothetical protein